MYMQSESKSQQDGRSISKRQNPADTGPDSQSARTWTYIVSAIIGVVMVCISLFIAYQRIRKLKIAGRSPKYIPTKYLKRKWDEWKPKAKYSNIGRQRSESEQALGLTTNGQTAETGGVNRNTSIRSIMTLPAYSQKPKETEEVIGREGERGGIDTVIELPETVEEEEDRRETEMESLYQIRQARRREIAERDERRRERREARERGDWTRLEELRRESQQRRNQNSPTNLAQNSASNVNLTTEMLIAEHNSRGRDRRVSSVSYAALGQVRHDGTRIRSDSHDSERSGLLNSAAPMGTHNRNASEATLLTIGGLPQPRYRDRSNSAATTASTTASSFDNVSPPSELARPTTSRTGTSSHHAGGSVSDLGAEEADVGTERLVISGTDLDDSPRPPEYDGHDWGQAPEYREEEAEQVSRANSYATAQTRSEGLDRTTSTTSRTETLSIITPSIQIQTPTAPNTPVVPRSGTSEHFGSSEVPR